MPTVWLTAPYLERTDERRTVRYVAVDDVGVLAANGYWDAADLGDGTALVRARADEATVKSLTSQFQETDPAKAAANGGGLLVAQLLEAVLDQLELDGLKILRDGYIARADQGEVVFIDPLPYVQQQTLLTLAARAGYGLDRIRPGTFPTNSTVLDNFDRADGGLGANWTTGYSGGASALSIVSNAVTAPSLAFGDGFWNVANYGPDSETYITLDALPSTGDQVSIMNRLQSPGSAAVDGYMFNLTDNAGADDIRMYVFINNGFTQLGATDSGTNFLAGDGMGMDTIGASPTTVTAYRETGGSWGSLLNRTDSTAGVQGVSGKMGMEAQHNLVRINDFSGGTVVTAGGVSIAWYTA